MIIAIESVVLVNGGETRANGNGLITLLNAKIYRVIWIMKRELVAIFRRDSQFPYKSIFWLPGQGVKV